MQEATILQIEDNEDILLLGKRVFMEAGFNFLSAKTGDEGLRKALKRKPSVIILDYYLGDETGTHFIKKLATEDKYKSIRKTPTIILSGNANLEKELEGYFALGLRAVLKKPFGYRELVNVVENIITLERLQSQAERLSADNPTAELYIPKWVDEVRMNAETISALSRDIYCAPQSSGMNEKIKMDLYAVYSSSRRLLQLIKENGTE